MRSLWFVPFACGVVLVASSSVSAQQDVMENYRGRGPVGTRAYRQMMQRENDTRRRQFDLDRLADGEASIRVIDPHQRDPVVEQQIRISTSLRELNDASDYLQRASVGHHPIFHKEILKYSEQVAKISYRLRKDLNPAKKAEKATPAVLSLVSDPEHQMFQVSEQIDDRIKEVLKVHLRLTQTLDVHGSMEVCEILNQIESHALGLQVMAKK
ncbi:MAG: hypothetical protein K1Y36_14680 [Blastocatellia bacterium]|nr:hypothetical protein [Blastocatellia bacterium]